MERRAAILHKIGSLSDFAFSVYLCQNDSMYLGWETVRRQRGAISKIHNLQVVDNFENYLIP